MSLWVRPKGTQFEEGDGEICFAGPDGPIHRIVVDGAFEWPEELGRPHASRYEVTEPSPEARERRRQQQIAALEDEAERLGYRLAQLREQGVAVGGAPQAQRSPEAVAAPASDAGAPAVPIQAAARMQQMQQPSLSVRRRSVHQPVRKG